MQFDEIESYVENTFELSLHIRILFLEGFCLSDIRTPPS